MLIVFFRFAYIFIIIFLIFIQRIAFGIFFRIVFAYLATETKYVGLLKRDHNTEQMEPTYSREDQNEEAQIRWWLVEAYMYLKMKTNESRHEYLTDSLFLWQSLPLTVSSSESQ